MNSAVCQGLLPTIRHFENRRGEGPGDEVELVVVVSRFEFVLCHTNVGPCVTGGCCDSCFIDDVLRKARTVKRQRFLLLQLHFFSSEASLFSLSIF